MEEQYILSSELVLLMAVWYLPPLVIAFTCQFILFRKWGALNKLRSAGVLGILVTLISSPLLGYKALSIPAGILPRWLGVTESLFILPMSFVIVGLVCLIITTGIFYVRKNA